MPAPQQSSWIQRMWDFIRKLFGSEERKVPPPPAPPPVPPAQGRFIAVDAGHGGNDPGARNQSVGLNEKTVTLAIAQKLQTFLESRGHQVLMTRNEDVFVELGRRAELANTAGTDIFVSIHCNSSDNTSATGIETYHHTNASQDGRALATNIHQVLVAVFPTHNNRGVKAANFVVLRETQMPACLVETEFISNNQQAQFLANPANQEKIAQAIADGIENYFQG
ncbi:MAG: N-acetylmuramoyl-L-alanine amidase [candidate division KSB1 bacterium]|nr:N-acetylmuramoyl-L-alanine amidase [candidate division KSB1 bacterium]MDZ7302456.1 N-acetylmuramoyl-L-alanine amidase [candidate division KSB1 bacterium]MDZ7311950.1 N-acetylmuramoyl-L-alanine amidase [candidate division KSB1 bacterium]